MIMNPLTSIIQGILCFFFIGFTLFMIIIASSILFATIFYILLILWIFQTIRFFILLISFRDLEIKRQTINEIKLELKKCG